MFANAQLARVAAEKELEEAQGRTTAQHALANARAQAAQRALVVAREKASNEAKSEFMSLMCHEVCLLQSVLSVTDRRLRKPGQEGIVPPADASLSDRQTATKNMKG